MKQRERKAKKILKGLKGDIPFKSLHFTEGLIGGGKHASYKECAEKHEHNSAEKLYFIKTNLDEA